MNDIREVGQFVTREPTSRWVFAPVRDQAGIGGRINVTRRISLLRDSAVVTGEADGKATSDLRETAQLSDRAYPSNRKRVDVHESAVIVGRAVTSRRMVADVRETAKVFGRTTAVPNVFDLRDIAVIKGLAAPSVRRQVLCREVAIVSGRARTVSRQDAHDTAIIAGRATGRAIRRPLVRDSGELSDASAIILTARSTMRESARLASRAIPVTTHRPLVRDRAWISGRAEFVVTSDTHAWSANVGTWAMSRYTGFPFESIAGKFAAGNAGVFSVGDGEVEAHIETGDIDFGSPSKKALAALYVVGTNTTPLDVSITADVRGQRMSADYQQMARDAADDRLIRSPIGKGFSSNYYRVRVGSGDPFVIHRAEAVVSAESRRRI